MSESPIEDKRKITVAVVDEYGTGVKDLDIGKILSDPKNLNDYIMGRLKFRKIGMFP